MSGGTPDYILTTFWQKKEFPVSTMSTPVQIPQPQPADIQATIASISADHQPLLTEVQMALVRRFGPIFLRPTTDGKRTIVLGNFALVDEVCDDQRFDKRPGGGASELRLLVGDGLFTAYTDEPNWHKAHNILLPTFSLQAMKSYMPDMLDLASQLMLKWERLNPDDEIDVVQDMTRLTLDTIGLCGFGYRFNSFYRTDQHPFVTAMVEALSAAMRAAYAPAQSLDLSTDAQFLADSNLMNALIDDIIRARKAEPPEQAAAHKDLLSYMLTGVDKQTGERLDDTTIRYEAITFLIAGHETTSGALSFALYFLLKHPDVIARAYDEVDRVLGADPGVQPTYEQVHQLTYCSQILKEALRLWPTAPGFTRHALQATTIGPGYSVTPDDSLLVVTPMLHRDPSVWGADAEAFNPDHFAPEAERSRPGNAFKTFGTGQRACIGRQFALQEATLVLGMLLQRFELLDFANYRFKLKQALTIKPDELKIKVRPREHRAAQIPVPAITITKPDAATTAATTAAAGADLAAAHGTPLLVLFGSNLGTCEDLAHRIANDGSTRGFSTTVAPLDDYLNKLPTDGAVVVVTSSYNGTPPDNATKFVQWMGDPALAADSLHGVRYAVFGCGNHEWTATYQAIPHLVDAQLAAHGAERLYPLGAGDAAEDLDGQFQAWYGPLWPALAQALGLDTSKAEAAVRRPLYQVERVSAPANPALAPNGVRPLTIRVNRELQAWDGDPAQRRSTRHVEVTLPVDMPYHTGDHLGIMARNHAGLIQRALTHFGFAGDAFIRIHRQGTGTPLLPLDQPVAVIDLLTRYVELQEVASRAQIATLATYTDCPPDRARLEALSDNATYQSEVLAKRLTLLDLLEEFPSVQLPFSEFLELLHPLRVRYYSISSSPAAEEHACSVTVAVVDAPARSGRGTYQGVCSTYLARHGTDSVVEGFVHSPHIPFCPPADAATPIIMVGPGTGFAPFRGFLQDRAARMAKGEQLAPALLFFGSRHPDHDFIYRDELEAYAAQGVVTLYTAFSRVEGQPKKYVQQVIQEHADEVWELLQRGAIVYICGDGGHMEPDVRQTLVDIYHAKTGLTPDDARAWQANLATSQRYIADVWANG
jgi:cytochrome P450/NADPH-cytochrome P450 reductase